MDIDSIYITFKNGSILTNLDPIWIQLLPYGICVEYCIGDEMYDYEDVYAIGKILEEGCEVLWCVTEIPVPNPSCDQCKIRKDKDSYRCDGCVRSENVYDLFQYADDGEYD